MMLHDDFVIVRGGGDLASGVAYALYKSGFKVLIVECEKPSAIRRTVSFCDAVYEGETVVEDIICKKADSFEQALSIIEKNRIAIIVDDNLSFLENIPKPKILIDAIIAKKNIGTNKDMADFVVALGPGFYATKDCDVVIETKRGHNLGRIIYEGSAEENSGIPGFIKGVGKERVVYSPMEGNVEIVKKIGDAVKKNEIIAYIKNGENKAPVYSNIDGNLRGMIREGFFVDKGMKMADVDPRVDEKENYLTVSDKSRSIGSSVLLAVLEYLNK